MLKRPFSDTLGLVEKACLTLTSVRRRYVEKWNKRHNAAAIDKVVDEIQCANQINRTLDENSISLGRNERKEQTGLSALGGRILPQRLKNARTLNNAIRHALYIRASDAVYTYIPKNACSSMRYSVALSNQLIDASTDVSWIHRNTQSMSVKCYEAAINPKFAFVILRCPFRRLVSVFFDKFLSARRPAHQFVNTYGNVHTDVMKMSFEKFVHTLSENIEGRELFNIHWRPQSEFLLYTNYDRYYQMEKFTSVIDDLSMSIGFSVYDTRLRLDHHTTPKIGVLRNVAKPWQLTVGELIILKDDGLPSVESMFNADLIERVSSLYREDIALYARNFGVDDLLFPADQW